MGHFLRSEFHDDSGMKNLMEAFYRSVMTEASLPLSYSEIVLTSRIMDRIFERLESESASLNPSQERVGVGV